MKRKVPPTQYKRDFAQRLKGIRESAGYKTAEFAKALGVEPNSYSKYECREGSLLPMQYISEVCLLTGHDPWFVLTGQANMPTGRFVVTRLKDRRHSITN